MGRKGRRGFLEISRILMIVRETISFERGKSPMSTMGIGAIGNLPKIIFEEDLKTGYGADDLGTIEPGTIRSIVQKSSRILIQFFQDPIRNIQTGKSTPKINYAEKLIRSAGLEKLFKRIYYEHNSSSAVYLTLIDEYKGHFKHEEVFYPDDFGIGMNESVNFQRGKDPREKMGIGDEGYRILRLFRQIAKSLNIEEVGVADLNPERAISSWKMPWLKGNVDRSGFGRIILFSSVQDDGIKVYSKGKRGCDIDQWQRWDSPRKWIENIKMLNESISFERGREPKDAMGLGDLVLTKDTPDRKEWKKGEKDFVAERHWNHGYTWVVWEYSYHTLPEDRRLVISDVEDHPNVESELREFILTRHIPFYAQYESVNFERGKDPKEGLGIGIKSFYDNLKRGDMMRLKKDLPNLGYYKGYLFRINGKVDDSTTSDGTPSKWVNSKVIIDLDGKDVPGRESPWNFTFDFFKENFIPVMNESVSFERGKDPKDTMKIGAKKLLSKDILGNQSGWTLPEKERPSKLLGLDPGDVYVLGFAGEIDYHKHHVNEFTNMLFKICGEGESIDKEVYGDNTYTLKDTEFGKIVMAELDTEGMYFYGGVDTALNIGIQDIPQEERESIF